MIFGGLQKQSLIDYPGKLSCVLFTFGCNFVCPYCHNPDLIRKPNPHTPVIKVETVYNFLENRTQFLEGVVITGGEPTLHGDLSSVCRKIKHMGYAIKLDTNGSHPEVLARLTRDNLLDYIAMDIKTDPAAYPRDISPQENTQNIHDSIAFIMTCGLPYEFRTTCIKPFVDERIIEKIARSIQGARYYALQQFKNDNILSPDFFRGQAPPYSRAELKQFQVLAAPWVQTCVIR